MSPYFEDFLGDAFREAIQIRAYLCLSDRQADPYETDANDGQITAGHLVWNHFVALHNSNRALRHCAAGLSEGKRGRHTNIFGPNPRRASIGFFGRKAPRFIHCLYGDG